jgi:hypothetical protein
LTQIALAFYKLLPKSKRINLKQSGDDLNLIDLTTERIFRWSRLILKKKNSYSFDGVKRQEKKKRFKV